MNIIVSVLATLLIVGIFVMAIVRVREQNKIRGSLENMRASHKKFMALLGQLEGQIYRRNSGYPDANSMPIDYPAARRIEFRNDGHSYFSDWHMDNICTERVHPALACYIHNSAVRKHRQSQFDLEELWLQEDAEFDKELLTVA